jgi:hypothetical protein
MLWRWRMESKSTPPYIAKEAVEMFFHVDLECLKQETLRLANPGALVSAREQREYNFVIRVSAVVASQFHRLAREPSVLEARM